MKNKKLKFKRILSFLIAAVFALSMMPLSFAAEEITLSGDGTVDNPYLIGSEAELVAFRKAVAADLATLAADVDGAVVVSTLSGKLTDNISLASSWVPIATDGTQKKLYGGTFDGNGYTISNMTAEMESVQGFVGEAGEGLVIKNLTLQGTYSKNSNQQYTGGFVGRSHGKVTLINCVNKIDITGKDRVAGFIGDGNYAHSFTNCVNYGDITGTTNVNGFLATGGNINVTYNNCANYGDIVANTSGVVAGFSGNGTLVNCIGYGSVTNSGPATATCNSYGNGTFSATNCFYREGAATGNPMTNKGTKKDASAFASGEVTYLINGSSAENVIYGQQVGYDDYPIPGKTDYPVYQVDGGYSNKNEALGTASNPYLIGSEAQLNAFRTAVNSGSGVSKLYAELTKDITLTSAWGGIGTSSVRFGGVIDGKGYTISNLTGTEDKWGFGLVSYGGEGLTFKNLTIEGALTVQGQSAGFVGNVNSAVTFENCINKVDIVSTAGGEIGGFIGNPGSYAHSYTNCANYGDMTSSKSSAVGGFGGNTGAKAQTFVNCANYGTITGSGGGVVAGISAMGTFTSCVGYGAVTNSNGPATATYNAWGENAATGCYYHSGVVTGSALPNGGTAKNNNEFASGEVTYLLNGSSAENVSWGQEIGVDAYPIFGKTDYPVYKLEYSYSNTPEPMGTETKPYLIGTEAELTAFKEIVSKDAQKIAEAAGTTSATSTLCAKLTADIELTSNWGGIGTENYLYGGIFDGDGYEISNLSTAESTYKFGFVNYGGAGLTFKNLTLAGDLYLEGRVGAFVGNAKAAVTFENCVNKANINAKELVGGFIGDPASYAHSFINCANYGNITNRATSYGSTVGGFMGNTGSASQTFVNCANYGAVIGDGSGVVAGIASNGVFTNCIGYGAVTNTAGPATATYNRNGNSGTNCYYLTDSATSGTSVLANGGTSKSADSFASGEVTYLLNSKANQIISGQDLESDTYPVFGKDALVYYNKGSYSNDSGIFMSADTDNALLAATDGATGYVAQYAANGALVCVKTVNVTEEITDYTIIPDANASTAKVFLWDSDMTPLCDGAEIVFPEAALVDFTVEVDEGRDISVLQLTDTQIIDSGQKRTSGRLGTAETNYWATDKIDERCLSYIGETVEATNPDLILLTGDIVYGEFDDNGSALLSLVEYMESLDIPWAPIMGNHENESKMGADWQCEVLENAENCLFKQRTLTGNGNYTVGIKQGGELKRVFFMLDSNGCGGMSAESKANGHMKAGFGFGDDQIEWYENIAERIVKYSPDTKLSVAFHGVPAFFREAAEKYGFDGTNTPIDIDNHADKADSDFGYIGQNFTGGTWGDELYGISKEVGVDSMFVGHLHGNNASIVHDGIRLQFGNKTGTYDRNNYREDDGSIAFSTTDAGFPMVGGTVMTVASADGAITDAYNYYCVNEY